jgi:hypothetical protein
MIHIVKLSVGAADVADLARWQAHQVRSGRRSPVCGTRAWPKRADEVLSGGSLYWVIAGMIRVRQPILEIAEVEDEHGLRCGLWLAETLVFTEPMARRPFQGWRYLEPLDAPADLPIASAADALPSALRQELRALGAW